MTVGVQLLQRVLPHEEQANVPALCWEPPPLGWTTLNIDGSFSERQNEAGAGMILRDESGAPIFSSCRELRHCSSPLESELAACMEGLALAIQWTTLPVIVQSDCLQLIHMIQAAGDDRSLHSMMVREIKTHLQEGREFVIKHVRREQNLVSHYLANFGRKEKRTAVWLQSGPGEVPELCIADMYGA
jgi:ribonuclease HI